MTVTNLKYITSLLVNKVIKIRRTGRVKRRVNSYGMLISRSIFKMDLMSLLNLIIKLNRWRK